MIVTCQHCPAQYNIDESELGKHARCSKCQHSFRILSDSMVPVPKTNWRTPNSSPTEVPPVATTRARAYAFRHRRPWGSGPRPKYSLWRSSNKYVRPNCRPIRASQAALLSAQTEAARSYYRLRRRGDDYLGTDRHFTGPLKAVSSTFTPLPEPSSAVLLAIGLMMCLRRRLRAPALVVVVLVALVPSDVQARKLNGRTVFEVYPKEKSAFKAYTGIAVARKIKKHLDIAAAGRTSLTAKEDLDQVYHGYLTWLAFYRMVTVIDVSQDSRGSLSIHVSGHERPTIILPRGHHNIQWAKELRVGDKLLVEYRTDEYAGGQRLNVGYGRHVRLFGAEIVKAPDGIHYRTYPGLALWKYTRGDIPEPVDE